MIRVDGRDDLEHVPGALRLAADFTCKRYISCIARPSSRMVTWPNSGSSIGAAFMAATTARPSVGEPGHGPPHSDKPSLPSRRRACSGPRASPSWRGVPASGPSKARVLSMKFPGATIPLRGFQAERRHALQVEISATIFCFSPRLNSAACLIELIGVTARIGEPDHLGAGGLRLQQEGREVRGRRAGDARCRSTCPAFRLHFFTRLLFQVLAERVVGGDQEPALAALRQHATRDAVAHRPGVRTSSARCWVSIWRQSEVSCLAPEPISTLFFSRAMFGDCSSATA